MNDTSTKLTKGVFLLTEGRSGSNWLGTLVRKAGFGRPSEWLDPTTLGLNPRTSSKEKYFNTIVEKATDGTCGFFVKVFPGQLHHVNYFFKSDFIQYARQNFEVSFVVLTRRDRLGQAISFARGLQTNQWTSRKSGKGEAQYDFDMICRCYFLIGRSYDYWRSYTDIMGVEAREFVYEDLLEDQSPFVNHIADCFEQPHPKESIKSDLEIQRDTITDDWRDRFLREIQFKEFINSSTPSRMPEASLENARRVLTKRMIKPYPYKY